MPAWLHRIARNAIIDHYRIRRAHRPLPTDDALDHAVDEREEVGPNQATQELARCLRPLIDQLPDKYRQAVTLVDLDGHTQVATARELGLSLSGTKSRVQRGRRQLRQLLTACCVIATDRTGAVSGYTAQPGQWLRVLWPLDPMPMTGVAAAPSPARRRDREDLPRSAEVDDMACRRRWRCGATSGRPPGGPDDRRDVVPRRVPPPTTTRAQLQHPPNHRDRDGTHTRCRATATRPRRSPMRSSSASRLVRWVASMLVLRRHSRC